MLQALLATAMVDDKAKSLTVDVFIIVERVSYEVWSEISFSHSYALCIAMQSDIDYR